MFKLFVDSITKKYFKINNRASRKEYFSFIFFSTLLTELTGLFFIINDQKMNGLISILVVISVFFTFYSFIPSITLTIRRLHDLNTSGWWGLLFIIIGVLLTSFAPRNIITTISIFIIATIGIYFVLKKGTPGPNKYGEPPT